ncbi:MAG: helix-turn-helix domain-containing protein [Micrococcaceae bacterium]
MFDVAKIVYVMDGAARIETELGSYELPQGTAFALGPQTWCSLIPTPEVRVWTIYADEVFLRTQMGWALPIKNRVLPGMHPLDWTGEPLATSPGIRVLRRIEPCWRQMSLLAGTRLPPEVAAARSVALFTRAVELSVEMLLVPAHVRVASDAPYSSPVLGSLASSASVGQAGKAAQILRTRMAEPWTVQRLGREVSLSRTHLTRLFRAQFGIAPIRFLTEIRLTEFTRLVEESDLAIEAAARTVGWTDSRIAASWFRRRFGISPSQFRRGPHPFVEDGAV